MKAHVAKILSNRRLYNKLSCYYALTVFVKYPLLFDLNVNKHAFKTASPISFTKQHNIYSKPLCD